MRGEILPLEDYVHSEFDRDRILPWQHLRGPLPLETLKKHLAEAETIMNSSDSASNSLSDSAIEPTSIKHK
jgi:hypothetical protein